MEVTNTMGAAEVLRKYLLEADPDLVRSMVQTFAEALMSAEASGLCNAEYGEVSPERVNSRNGYRRGASTRGPARSSWRSRSSGRAATSPTG